MDCKQQKLPGRFFSKLVMLAVLLASPTLQALGLGDISTSSYLGQPLQASIQIRSRAGIDEYDASQIRVRYLGEEEAGNLGIDLAGGYHSFQIKPVLNKERLSLELSSHEPVNEPFLNLLVELSWPTGKVYREYTMFLNPKVFSAQSVPQKARPSAIGRQQPAASPQQTTATIAGRVNIDYGKPSTIQPGSGAATSISPNLSSSQSGSGLVASELGYQVRSGDNLSKIAGRLVQGSNTSRHEMMQWLLANNPQAFIQGDKNRILAGARLALPERHTPVDSAKAEAGMQPSTKSTPTVGKPQVKTAASSRLPPERLTIVTPGVTSKSVPEVAAPEAARVARLRTQVASTNEMIDKLQRQNEMLQQRLEKIEKSQYIASLERLVQLKENEINTLRKKLDSSKQARAGELVSVPAAVDPASKPQAESGTGRRLWLILLVLVALVGACIFYYRWRSREHLEEQAATIAAEEGDTLQQNLDDMVDSQASFEAFTPQPEEDDGQMLAETREAFDIISDENNRSQRRPEEVVKRSIKDKVSSYTPRGVTEQDKDYHDQLDNLISEAIDMANRGEYEIAEAMLLAERTQQARIPTGDSGDIDSRLELALQFVAQRKKGK